MSGRKDENCLRYLKEVDVGTPEEEIEPGEERTRLLRMATIGPNVWQRSMWVCHICKALIDIRCGCKKCGSERAVDAPTYTVEKTKEFDAFLALSDEAYAQINGE